MASFAVPRSFENPCPNHASGPGGVLITQLLQTLLAAQCTFGNPGDYPEDYGNKLSDNEEFDFIVVGAGSSGSVIARRLAENADWKILLLEAGGDPSFVSDVPGFLFSTQGSEIDWKYSSEKSEHSCQGMFDQKCPYPRGKVLGGSSTINAMLYVRGNPQDYNEWADHGNDGWDYENVLKYFKKSENLNGYSLASDETHEKNNKIESFRGKVMSEKYHSASGLLSVSPYADDGVADIKNAILGAVRDLNYPTFVDVNGKHQIGFNSVPGTLFQGTRANTAKMFLKGVKDRENLIVVKNAVAKKLIIKNKKVEGVEFVRINQTRVVRAKKEVIVSAGAINSPQLLLLSGIGPKDHLEAMGIPTVVNLKGVGKNFQDHSVFLGMPFSILKSGSQTLPSTAALDAMYMFLTGRGGLFSSIGLTDVTGFVDTKDNSSVPDIQYVFVNFLKNDNYLLPEVVRVMHFNEGLKEQYMNMVKDSGVVLIAPVLIKPKGRGSVKLRSSNPGDVPKIYADLLNDPEDRETLLRGVEFLMKLEKTPSFQKLEPNLVRFKIAECDNYKVKSEEYWRCLMKYLTVSLYHPVGTCKMGPKDDSHAVVDSRLRVHGIINLRVADASIMPTIVRGNTNAPSIMIGEKCADFVKDHWNRLRHTEF